MRNQLKSTLSDPDRAGRCVNATELCRPFLATWDEFWHRRETQEFLVAVSSSDCVDVDALVGCDKQGNVWIDQRVARRLLSWLRIEPMIDPT